VHVANDQLDGQHHCHFLLRMLLLLRCRSCVAAYGLT
jgi:hypothetical protein